MTQFIVFPEQFYVGLKTEKDSVPLGFATPNGIDTAFEKRKETVDRWSAPYHYLKEAVRLAPLIIDNKPISGFTFEKSVSRWTTSNKWFRIIDPRGFMLEIAADNLAEIILNSTIEKGDIQGEFLWGRIGQVNQLVRIDDPRYLEFLTPKVEMLEIGDEVIGSRIDGYYAGLFYVHRLSSRSVNVGRGQWGLTYRYEIVLEHNEKPYHVFLKQYNRSDYVAVDFSRQIGKIKIMKKMSKTPEEMTVLVEGCVKDHMVFLHKTKTEHDKFMMSPQKMKENYNNLYNTDKYFSIEKYGVFPEKVTANFS